MKHIDVIRALKDRSYRNKLSPQEQAKVGENPAGMAELDDAMLEAVAGASSTSIAGCSQTIWSVCRF